MKAIFTGVVIVLLIWFMWSLAHALDVEAASRKEQDIIRVTVHTQELKRIADALEKLIRHADQNPDRQ